MPGPFVGFLPNLKNADVTEFTWSNNTTINGWQTWEKPQGCSFVYILAISSGGSGGGGFTAATSTSRTGGSGGGSGAVSTILIPSMFIPDSLAVFVPAGGPGVAGNTAGVNGATAFVTTIPNKVSNLDYYTVSAAGTAAGGGKGLATAVTGGAAAAVNAPAAILGFAGIYSQAAGQAGSSSSVGGPGGTVTVNSASHQTIGTAGAAGGSASTTNTDAAGGGINGGSWIPNLAGGTAGGGNGVDGYTLNQNGVWISMGGTGGGSNAAGTGGNGGKGGLGCGGGGGGGGITGGRGGAGGDGYVMIAVF